MITIVIISLHKCPFLIQRQSVLGLAVLAPHVPYHSSRLAAPRMIVYIAAAGHSWTPVTADIEIFLCSSAESLNAPVCPSVHPPVHVALGWGDFSRSLKTLVFFLVFVVCNLQSWNCSAWLFMWPFRKEAGNFLIASDVPCTHSTLGREGE